MISWDQLSSATLGPLLVDELGEDEKLPFVYWGSFTQIHEFLYKVVPPQLQVGLNSPVTIDRTSINPSPRSRCVLDQQSWDVWKSWYHLVKIWEFWSWKILGMCEHWDFGTIKNGTDSTHRVTSYGTKRQRSPWPFFGPIASSCGNGDVASSCPLLNWAMF